MGKLTELRGALGGGIASITWSNGAAPNLVIGKRVRVVQAKRQVCYSLFPLSNTLILRNDSPESALTLL